MKTHTRLLAMLLSLPAAAAEIPSTPQGWAQRMLVPTQNGLALRDPQAFTQWLGALGNPATALALAGHGVDPNTHARMLAAMAHPATLQNYLQFTDANTALRWLAAGMDPNFYAAALTQGLNPANSLAWLSLPVNPQAWGLGMQMLNPVFYANWIRAPLKPNVQGAMLTPLDAAAPGHWSGAASDPQGIVTTGAAPAAPAPSASAAPPVASVPVASPAQSPVLNPLDPANLLNFINPATAGKK